MNKELAKTLTLALVNYIDENRPEGTMDCSSGECVSLEKAFTEENFDSVETHIKKKLSRLTEFEQALSNYLKNDFEYFYTKKWDEQKWNDVIRTQSKELLALAKKELAKRDEVITLDNLPPYDKGFQDGKAEAMADLERAFECNPEKLPLWLRNELDRIKLEAHTKGYNKGYKKAEEEYNKSVSYHYDDELAKKHLDGYCMGREDTMREMKDFIESHFNTNKAREGEDLTDLYRKEYAQPLCLRDGGVCTNPMRDCINCIPTLEFNTSSGTSTATLHGNTSVTDGREHNPSFID